MEFYDIRKVESSSLILNLENGSVEKPRYERSFSKGFRFLKNGFWGIFSGNVPDKEGIERAKANAVEKGDASVVEAGKGGKYVMKVKKNPEDVSIEEKVKLMREIEKELKADYIVSTKVVYMENVRKFSYADSFGTEAYYEVTRSGVIIQAVGKDDVMQFYSRRILKPAGYEMFDDSVFEIASDVRERLCELLKAKLPPSGEMDVIMDSNLCGVFVHEAFGHAVEADHVLQGSTVLAGRIGEKVACEEVYIYDDPTLMEFGFYPFDDEGVKAERKVIVERGVLKSYLHSRETAAKLKGKPGNARAQGVAEPIVRMSNTFMAKGEYSFDELLEEAKNGVFLAGSRGGETNPATGYFQFNAQYGYIVRNGELAEPIRDVSLSGNTLSILKNIKLGNSIEFDPGFCGKAGQLVPVSDGAPLALVRAKVGGVA